MSVDSVLDQAFTTLLAKARQRTVDDTPVAAAQTAVILINFDGGGVPLVAGASGNVPEITFPCTILACHLYAGIVVGGVPQPVAVSAGVELRLGAQGLWASGSVPLYGGTRPGMTAVAEANPSIAGWTTELQPGDLLPNALFSFTGPATFLTVALPVRRLEVVGLGVLGLTDGAGDAFTDAGGASFTIRG